MITREDYLNYFSNIVAALDLKVNDVKKYVNHAINAGIKQFWGANNWTFKESEYTLTVSSAAESYDLPADFEGMKTIREKTTTQGLRLKYFPKEAFDTIAPKLTTFQDGTPQMYTIFGAKPTSERLKISFFPRPSSDTLYLLYYKTSPKEPEVIPDKYQSGVEAFIATHIYLFNNKYRMSAYQEALNELKRLVQVDKMDMSDPVRYQDDTDRAIYTSPPYYASE